MDELMHYGVKGMKWGKRKKDNATIQKEAVQKAKDLLAPQEKSSGVKVTTGTSYRSNESIGTYIVNGRRYQTTASGAKKIQEEYNRAMAYGTGGGGAATSDEEFEEAIRKKADEKKKNKKVTDFLSKSKTLRSKSVTSTTSVKKKVTDFLAGLKEKKKKKKKSKVTITVESKLMHYGVPGMKWGVRKARPTSSGKRRGKTNAQRIYESVTGKKNPKPVTKTSSKPAKRRISDMSDEELRTAINRMQMERTYAQLTSKEVSKGRKFVNEVLYNSAKSVATDITKEAMKKAIRRTRNSSGSSGGGP